MPLGAFYCFLHVQTSVYPVSGKPGPNPINIYFNCVASIFISKPVLPFFPHSPQMFQAPPQSLSQSRALTRSVSAGVLCSQPRSAGTRWSSERSRTETSARWCWTVGRARPSWAAWSPGQSTWSQSALCMWAERREPCLSKHAPKKVCVWTLDTMI